MNYSLFCYNKHSCSGDKFIKWDFLSHKLLGWYSINFYVSFLFLILKTLKKFRYNSHAVKFTILKGSIHCFFLNIFKELCDYYHYLVAEHFHHPQKKLCTYWQSPALPQPLVTTSLCLWICLFWHFRWMESCNIRSLGPGFFHWHNDFKVRLCCSKYQYFLAFYGWIIFYLMAVPHFLYPFIGWWSFRLFPLSGC